MSAEYPVTCECGRTPTIVTSERGVGVYCNSCKASIGPVQGREAALILWKAKHGNKFLKRKPK